MPQHDPHAEGVPSEAFPSLRADQQRKKRRAALIGGGLVVAIAAGAYAIMVQIDRQADERVAAAWGKLERCLVGDPLAEGETASGRFRNIQLAAMVLPEAKRAEVGAQPWPDRCASPAHAVTEALKDAGRAKKDEKGTAAHAEALAKIIKDEQKTKNPLWADLTAAIDPVWESAQKDGLRAAPADGPPPPPAARPITVDALKAAEPLAKGAFGLKNLFTEPHGAPESHFLVEDKSLPDSPFLCKVQSAEIACKKLPAAVAAKSGLRLLGTADEGVAPLVFAGNRGSDGVFRSDTGELVASLYSYGGHATKDGFVGLLGWDDAKNELRIVRKPAGKDAEIQKLKLDLGIANYFYSTMLLWDQLVIRGATKDDGIRLFARPLAHDGGDPTGPETDIGQLNQGGGFADGIPDISGCRSKDGAVVRVQGAYDEALTFYTGGRYSPPVLAHTSGVLTCRKGEATLTRFDHALVSQSRCTSAGCQDTNEDTENVVSKLKDMAPRRDFLAAADVVGKVLVVWAAGERGGLRMRLAPMEQLAQAPDVVLFDDLVQDGKVQQLSTMFEMRIVPVEGAAVLILNTVAGVYPIRIDAEGKFAPMKVSWAK